MENNDLKEKIRKNIKEEIAISNIRKEFGMKIGKNKKHIKNSKKRRIYCIYYVLL